VTTGPVAAENAEGDLLLKITFGISQGTMATFYIRNRQIYDILVSRFLRIPCTKYLEIGSFISYSKSKKGSFMRRSV